MKALFLILTFFISVDSLFGAAAAVQTDLQILNKKIGEYIDQFSGRKLSGAERVSHIFKFYRTQHLVRIESDKTMLDDQQLQECVDSVLFLHIRAPNITTMPELFYTLLPNSLWSYLNLAQSPQLDDETKQRITKAWVATGRYCNNIKWPSETSSKKASQETSTFYIPSFDYARDSFLQEVEYASAAGFLKVEQRHTRVRDASYKGD
jgi:hypothetical protein